jgi:hypothetical protein
MDKKKMIIIAIVLIAGAGLAIWFFMSGTKKEGEEAPPASPDQAPGAASQIPPTVAAPVSTSGSVNGAASVLAQTTSTTNQIPMAGGIPFAGTPNGGTYVSKNGFGTVGIMKGDPASIGLNLGGIGKKAGVIVGYILDGVLYKHGTEAYNMIKQDWLITHGLPTS